MHRANINKFMGTILEELEQAEEKHPKFADKIIDESKISWAETEFRIKAKNMTDSESHADNILMEEIAEAFAAISAGDKEHALQEFAKCGAVIMRCMELVEREMKV